MSICDSDMWKVGKWQEGYYHWCPCYSEERSVYSCGLDVFEPHDEYVMATGERHDNRPDSCPHATALKAVVANPDLVLVALPRGVTDIYVYDSDECTKLIYDERLDTGRA